MQGFSDVKITWKGADYTVPAERQLMLVAEVEDALRGNSGKSAVQLLLQRGGPGHARLAMAYGAALRYAGAAVTDDEIYLSIQNDMAQSKADVVMAVQSAIVALIAIVSPPIGAELSKGDTAGEEKKTENSE